MKHAFDRSPARPLNLSSVEHAAGAGSCPGQNGALRRGGSNEQVVAEAGREIKEAPEGASWHADRPGADATKDITGR